MTKRTLLLSLLLSLSITFASAQSDVPIVIPAAEYNIGLDCPIAQTLAPDGEILWVLFKSCFSGSNSLQAFNVADGSPVELANDFAAALEPLKSGYVDRFTNPMVVVDGMVSIRYTDSDTYEPRSINLALDGAAAAPVIDDKALNELLLDYTEYPETAVYNADHTQAAVSGASSMTVLDLATGETVFSLPLEPDSYNAYPSFSADGQTVYVAQLNNLDDMEDYSAALSAYHLPDGTLMSTVTLPTPFAWISPNGSYAAVESGSNDGTQSDLFVVDLTSGGLSESFSLYEPPTKALTCVNDGRDLSDVDFPVSGRLSLVGISWLPDSSGFVFARSYGGEAVGGGRPCALNYSRLNRFEIGS